MLSPASSYLSSPAVVLYGFNINVVLASHHIHEVAQLWGGSVQLLIPLCGVWVLAREILFNGHRRCRHRNWRGGKFELKRVLNQKRASCKRLTNHKTDGKFNALTVEHCYSSAMGSLEYSIKVFVNDFVVIVSITSKRQQNLKCQSTIARKES